MLKLCLLLVKFLVRIDDALDLFAEHAVGEARPVKKRRLITDTFDFRRYHRIAFQRFFRYERRHLP